MIAYGRTTAADRGTIVSYEQPWPEVVDLFREPTRDKISTAKYLALNPEGRQKHKNTGLFFGGRCGDGVRKDETVLSRSVVNLDLDSDCDQIWDELKLFGVIAALQGVAHIVHSTRSHSEDKPKFRILVPLSREAGPEEYQPVARALAEMLDPSMRAVARESYTVAQGMYFPSVSSDQEYHFFEFDGEFFDPDSALEKYPADKPETWPRKTKEAVSVFNPGRKIAHPEEKKAVAPIITAVHRAIGPYRMIEEFLSHVYESADGRYRPFSATGAASVRVYDDTFIHSDHGSDPACGQHNSFDLGRIHLFGNLDAEFETQDMSPVEWPSYKAMVEFALQQDDVREVYEEIVNENEVEKNTALLALLDEFEEDDLIGESPKATIEIVLDKVRRVIAGAPTLNELEKRLEVIRAMPLDEFKDLHRNLVAPDIQKKFKELGQSLTKAEARKLLKPTMADLRNQLASRDMPDWMKDWCYIVSENKFINIESKEILSKDGFNGKFNSAISKEIGSTELGLTIVTAFDAATQVYGMQMPYATRYHPLKPALFEEDGSLFVNTYRAPSMERSPYKGHEGVDLLKRLVADLFPDKRNQNIVFDFFVHCVRYPGKKLKYALLVKGSEEEGKSLLASLTRKMLGRHNTMIVGPDLLKEKYNGWSHEKLFCTVEEIKIVGKQAYEVLNKIKPVITNEETSVRKMQKDATTELNFCNIYLTTNYEDALPLEEDNTRFCVLFTQFRTNEQVIAWREKREKKEGRDYVKDLWRHINDNPHQFISFFESYKFSRDYAPEARAPMTEFKRIMAEDTRTDERQLLEDMLSDASDPSITNDILLWDSFKQILDLKNIGGYLSGGAVSRFLKPLGFIRARDSSCRISGKTQHLRVWTRNPELVGEGNHLTIEGRKMAIQAFSEKSELDDSEILKSNVVPLRR